MHQLNLLTPNSNRAEISRAILAGAHRPQIIVAEDASGMAVGEINFDGVVTDGLRGARAGLGLIHWQHARSEWSGCARRRGPLGGLFVALVVTGRAGAILPQINKVVVARVPVAPGDVHTFASGNVNLHVGGFFPGIDWGRHFILAAR